MSTFALFDFSNKTIRRVQSLDQPGLQKYREACHHLLEFHQARKLIQMVERNRAEMEEEFRTALGKLEASASLAEAREELELEVNRRLLNYLTTMRLFLDQTETRLKRRYGKDGAPTTKVLARYTNAYDSSFGYRFLYKLRNFGQHQALPVGHVRVGKHLDPVTRKTFSSVELSFDTRALLEQGKGQWGTVEAELQAAPPLLDVKPLIDDASSQLADIEQTVLEAERPELLRSVSVIEETLRPVTSVGGVPVVGRLTGQGAGGSIEIIRAPREVLTWLGYQAIAVEV